MDFTILNWNVGGAKYLEFPKAERDRFKHDLNFELKELIRGHNPNVITLQEIVRYGPSPETVDEIIEDITGYRYCPFPLIDTHMMSATRKWSKVKEKAGDWPEDYFFAQGNGFLFKESNLPFPVWGFGNGKAKPKKEHHFVEQVTLQVGLYFGNRDTEPRAALVAHLILVPEGENEMPLDVFVVNLHLTTLGGEREGIPKKDEEGSKIRLTQLEAIFNGIVSPYNTWRNEECGKDCKRYRPVWILAGDFNFTPESVEYQSIMTRNFIDVCPNKGKGTKSKGMREDPTLTVDYIFAGPKFYALNPLITNDAVEDNPLPFGNIKISDHFALKARIPLAIKGI